MDAEPLEFRAAMLRRFAAAFFLMLVAATWPLWTPSRDFPRVPFAAWLGRLPDAVQDTAQWLAISLVIAAWIAVGVAKQGPRVRPLTIGALGCTLLAVSFDEHRFQAWVYHLTLSLMALALLPAVSARRWLRWLTVSIYLFSAWSKCDHAFITSLGPVFAGALVKAVGLSTEAEWFRRSSQALACLFPLGEMLVALTLAWPRSRQLGVVLAVISHGLLLVILGPWGLNHRPGVLLWNVYFIVQTSLLMWRSAGRASQPVREPTADSRVQPAATSGGGGAGGEKAPRQPLDAVVVRAALAMAIVLPLGEAWGICDPWLAWSLYAPGIAKTEIYVRFDSDLAGREDAGGDTGRADASEADSSGAPAGLPAAARPFLGNHSPQGWRLLRADLWSLSATHSPIAPQSRFQLAVALWLADAVEDHDRSSAARVRVVRWGPADRWTGQREPLPELVGREAIRNAAADYWLNAMPRETFPPTTP